MKYAQGISEAFQNGQLVGRRSFETDGKYLAVKDGDRVSLMDVEQMVSHPSKKSLLMRLQECSRRLQKSKSSRRRKRHTRSKRSKKSKRTRRHRRKHRRRRRKR